MTNRDFKSVITMMTTTLSLIMTGTFILMTLLSSFSPSSSSSSSFVDAAVIQTVNDSRIVMSFGNNQYGQLGLQDSSSLWKFDVQHFLETNDSSVKVLHTCVINDSPDADSFNDFESVIGALPATSKSADFDPFPFHGIMIDSRLNVYTWGYGSRAHANDKRMNIKLNYELQLLFNINDETVNGAIGSVTPQTGVSSLACGREHTILITEPSSRVIVFGSHQFGQLGVGDNATTPEDDYIVKPMRSPLLEEFGFKSVWAVGDRTFAVDHDGDSYAFGDNVSGQLCLKNSLATVRDTPERILNETISQNDRTLKSVSGGTLFTILLTSTGEVYGCGLDTKGESLGINGTTNSYFEPQSIMSNVEYVSSVGLTTVAVDITGKFYYWGANLNGQIGFVSTGSTITPKVIPGANISVSDYEIKQISLSRYSLSIVVQNVSTSLMHVLVRGNNTFGSLGVLEENNSNLPPSYLSSWTKVSSKGGNGAKASFTNNVQIQSIDSNLFIMTHDKELYVIGENSRLPGPSVIVSKPTVVKFNTDNLLMERISAGYQVSAAIAKQSGKLFLWGAQKYPNAFLTSGHSSFHVQSPMEFIGLKGFNVSSIYMGSSASQSTDYATVTHPPFVPTTFIVLYNDSTKATAWGSNQYGQLGYTYINETFSPVYHLGDITPLRLKNFHKIAVSGRHMLALSEEAVSGSGIHPMLVSGDGTIGQIGGALKNREGLLRTESARDIAVGDFHSIYLNDNSTVMGTGDSHDGRAGITPLQVTSWIQGTVSNVEKIFSGAECSFFVLKNGTVLAAGSNSHGQIGLPSNIPYASVPVAVPGINSSVLTISSAMGGGAHTLILMADGRIFVSGKNNKGQLGLGTTVDQFGFVQLSLPQDSLGLEIAAGFDHSLIIVGQRSCPNACAGRGACDPVTGKCSCFTSTGIGGQSFIGFDCSLLGCKDPFCNGKGTCDLTRGRCRCQTGYTGQTCEFRKCPNNCSGRGTCDRRTGTCTCPPGFNADPIACSIGAGNMLKAGVVTLIVTLLTMLANLLLL